MTAIDFDLDMASATDEENLLGAIKFLDGNVTFSERDTYIDSWLLALITALEHLDEDQPVSMEIVEEPFVLSITPIASGYEVGWRENKVTFSTRTELEDAVRSAALKLIDQITYLGFSPTTDSVRRITDFVALR